MFTDYYAVLEIEPSACAAEVRRAFKKMALRCHPDKMIAPTCCHVDGTDHCSDARSSSQLDTNDARASVTDAHCPNRGITSNVPFAEVQEAYEVLSDVARRYLYDLNYAELLHYRREQEQQQKLQHEQDLSQRSCQKREHGRSTVEVAATHETGESALPPTYTPHVPCVRTPEPMPEEVCSIRGSNVPHVSTTVGKVHSDAMSHEMSPPQKTAQQGGVHKESKDGATDSMSGGAKGTSCMFPVIGQALHGKGGVRMRCAGVPSSHALPKRTRAHSPGGRATACELDLDTTASILRMNDKEDGADEGKRSSPVRGTDDAASGATDPPPFTSHRVVLPVLHMPTASIAFTPCAQKSRRRGGRMGAVSSITRDDRRRADSSTRLAQCQRQSIRKTMILFFAKELRAIYGEVVF